MVKIHTSNSMLKRESKQKKNGGKDGKVFYKSMNNLVYGKNGKLENQT